MIHILAPVLVCVFICYSRSLLLFGYFSDIYCNCYYLLLFDLLLFLDSCMTNIIIYVYHLLCFAYICDNLKHLHCDLTVKLTIVI